MLFLANLRQLRKLLRNTIHRNWYRRLLLANLQKQRSFCAVLLFSAVAGCCFWPTAGSRIRFSAILFVEVGYCFWPTFADGEVGLCAVSFVKAGAGCFCSLFTDCRVCFCAVLFIKVDAESCFWQTIEGKKVCFCAIPLVGASCGCLFRVFCSM